MIHEVGRQAAPDLKWYATGACALLEERMRPPFMQNSLTGRSEGIERGPIQGLAWAGEWGRERPLR